MTRFYRRSRTDANHSAIGAVLRRVTVVADVHGDGTVGCDFIAKHIVTKAPVLIEVKDPTKKPSARKLTGHEEAMAIAFPDHFRLVLTEEDALRAVGALG